MSAIRNRVAFFVEFEKGESHSSKNVVKNFAFIDKIIQLCYNALENADMRKCDILT